MLMKNIVARNSVLCLALGLAGCGNAPEKIVPAAIQSSEKAASHEEGWWCNEHGVPESVCAQCSAKIAADFKAKGDWCKEHDRPESQCFVCNPKLEAKFAAQYEAKYGKAPPKPN